MKTLWVLLLLIAIPCAALGEDYAFYADDGRVLLLKSESASDLSALGEYIMLGVGESIELTSDAENVVFKSLAESILSVDADGIALAVGVGETLISAHTPDGTITEIKARVFYAPTEIKLSANKGAMLAGDTYQLTYSLPNLSVGSVEWQSSDEEVVYVDDNGLLTATGAGECVISVETYNGMTDECAVIVSMPAPAVVTLPSNGGYMCVGETYALTATLTGGYMETISWSSTDESVLLVDSDGVLTALSEGTSTVRALASGGGFADCAVTVLAGSTGIQIKPDNIVMYVGGSAPIEARAIGGSGKKTVESDRETVVSVNEKGDLLTAHSAGVTTVKARTPNGIETECTVIVLNKPEPFELIARSNAVAVSESVKLSFATDEPVVLPIEYISSDPSVAKVDASGNVTGVKVGKAKITATAGGASTELTVSVMKLATGITLDDTMGVMGVGDRYTLKYKLKGGAGNPLFYSDKPDVVSVDSETGDLLALSEGTATITCGLKNGRSASCAVTVSPAPTKIEIVERNIVMGAGDDVQLHYKIDDSARGSVTWSSDNIEIMSVNDSGVATARGEGAAVVRATTHNMLTAEIAIDVLSPPKVVETTAFALAKGSAFDYYLLMKKGETRALNASCPAYTHATIEYASSQQAIAAVSPNGEVTALSKGTTIVTARAYSGAQTTVLIEVE